ncbi:MAG: hypothetical protein FJX23_08330 [Alphaproteobacteria bacterium]|nr:hypothetical protein [Alphaproteobacteria bacterium]
MSEISEYEREKWRGVAEREIASKLADGTIVAPDAGNPAHDLLVGIAQEVAKENGIDPKIYILPVQGQTEEHRLAHARSSLGSFSALHPVNAVIIPEAAAEHFTRAETAAVLNHEMDHLIREDLFYDKVRAIETAEDSAKEAYYHQRNGSHPKQVAEVEQKRDANIATLSGISTEAEVAADERAIGHGHAAHLASALEKMEIARSAADKVGQYPREDIIKYVSAVRESQREVNNPVKAAQHTGETFVQRLARLEKAAEGQQRSR